MKKGELGAVIGAYALVFIFIFLVASLLLVVNNKQSIAIDSLSRNFEQCFPNKQMEFDYYICDYGTGKTLIRGIDRYNEPFLISNSSTLIEKDGVTSWVLNGDILRGLNMNYCVKIPK